MTTPDASTTRTGSNPFGAVAKPAAELRVTELTADRDQLDRDNELLGSQIAELLSDKFDAALADDHESLEEQIASAQALNEDLEAIKAMLTGTSTVAPASALVPATSDEERAIRDIRSGALKLETEPVPNDDGTETILSAWNDPVMPQIITARRAKRSTTRPSVTPAPAAPATTDPPKRGGVLGALEDVVAGLREDPPTRRGQHR